jgi:hypothetical protein
MTYFVSRPFELLLGWLFRASGASSRRQTRQLQQENANLRSQIRQMHELLAVALRRVDALERTLRPTPYLQDPMQNDGWREIGQSPDGRLLVILPGSPVPILLPLEQAHHAMPDWEFKTEVDQDGKMRVWTR